MESHVNMLLEHFDEREGAQAKQEAVMEVLQLNSSQKIQAANAVKSAFPSSTVTRKGTGADCIQLYKNICSKSFPGPMSTSKVPSFGLNKSSEIANIKALIPSATIDLIWHKKILMTIYQKKM